MPCHIASKQNLSLRLAKLLVPIHICLRPYTRVFPCPASKGCNSIRRGKPVCRLVYTRHEPQQMNPPTYHPYVPCINLSPLARVYDHERPPPSALQRKEHACGEEGNDHLLAMVQHCWTKEFRFPIIRAYVAMEAKVVTAILVPGSLRLPWAFQYFFSHSLCSDVANDGNVP